MCFFRVRLLWHHQRMGVMSYFCTYNYHEMTHYTHCNQKIIVKSSDLIFCIKTIKSLRDWQNFCHTHSKTDFWNSRYTVRIKQKIVPNNQKIVWNQTIICLFKTIVFFKQSVFEFTLCKNILFNYMMEDYDCQGDCGLWWKVA